ncbi:uncharacterized protein LOC143622606 [Bidens hawaiensis]|uniref:uncharacterized protein LOC143622606 n=1 Tax=Bidens hawaiensis TaxID=980011 RepID=UPI00404B0FBD
MAENNHRKWYLLNKLKTMVKKVTFLMNSNINKWRLVSAFTGGGGLRRRRLSFREQFGLTIIVSSSSDDEEENNNIEFGPVSSVKELNRSRSFHVQRTMSFRDEEDIDKRAEMFIENFYRQLRYQRQVSLELRYTRNPSFESSESSKSFSP